MIDTSRSSFAFNNYNGFQSLAFRSLTRLQMYLKLLGSTGELFRLFTRPGEINM